MSNQLTAWTKIQAEITKAAPWTEDEMTATIVRAASSRDATQEQVAAKQKEVKKYTAQLNAFREKTEKEITELLPKVGAQAMAVIGAIDRNSVFFQDSDSPNALKSRAGMLAVYRERLRAAIAGGPAETLTTPKAVTPVPAPAPAPAVPIAAAAVPQPTPTVKQVGAAALAAITSANPAVRAPAVEGLNKSIEAASKIMYHADFGGLSSVARMDFMKAGGKITTNKAEANTGPEHEHKATLIWPTPAGQDPDFSFLKGDSQKTPIQFEYAREGGLAEERWFYWVSRRLEFCRNHGITPEEIAGREIVYPALVLETKAEVYSRVRTWDQTERGFLESIASMKSEIEKIKAVSPTAYRDRQYEIDRLNRGIAHRTEMLAQWKVKSRAEHERRMAAQAERIEAKRRALF